MGIMSTALRSLFPRGNAWRLPGNIGLVVEGLADTLERSRTFLRAAIAESLPGTATSMLPEWHTALGRKYDATMSVANQRRMLKAVHTALGGVGINDLNGQMHKELESVNFSEIAFNGATDECGVAECGGAECNSTVSGLDANPYSFLVSGAVVDDMEAGRVISVLAHFAPLHLQPTSSLIILSDTSTSESGVDQCGISECNAA